MALIFVPRETEPGESRVAATPETVKGYTKLGLQVAVESGAGLASGFRDADYEAAGARIGGSLGEADLVLMVRTPQPGAIAGMKRGAVLA